MPACPHCGHETDAGEVECPLCGTPLEGAPRGEEGLEPAAGTHDGAAAAAADAGRVGPGAGRSAVSGGEQVPWEDPEMPFPRDLWETWKGSLFTPAEFFGRVDDEGTVLRALLYYLLLTVAGAFFALLWQAVGFSVLDTEAYLGAGRAAAAGPVVSFFTTPFVALFALIIVTLLYHLGALLLAPERRGLAATARVVCYAAGPSVLAVVPIFGSLVGAVWSLVLQVVGLREVHRTGTGRAVVMVFWIWILLFLFTLGLLVLAAAVGGGGADTGPLVRLVRVGGAVPLQ